MDIFTIIAKVDNRVNESWDYILNNYHTSINFTNHLTEN